MDRAAASRALSTRFFGTSGETVRVELNASIDRLLEAMGNTQQAATAEDLVQAFPFLQRLYDAPVTLPPEPPVLNPDSLEQALSNYLRDSRFYRKRFPTYDRATKMDMACPTNSSTHVKFDLGYDTAGCTHVGAGRSIASSAADASEFIDWMQGTDVFLQDIKNDFIVSDLAIPDEDGLGCGTYPALLIKIKEWFHQGKRIIAKLNIFDYWRLRDDDIPVKILYKPRPHNLEVITSINIQAVELDESDVLEGIIERNVIRNEQIYAQHLPITPFENIHVECFADGKDYASMVADLDIGDLGLFARDRVRPDPPTPQELEKLIQVGMQTWHDMTDTKAILSVQNAVDDYVEGIYMPPSEVAEIYDTWPEEYKKARPINLGDIYLSGGVRPPPILTVPLAFIVANMHDYSVEKIYSSYITLVMQALGLVKFEKRGQERDLQSLYNEAAQNPRN